MNRCVRFVVIVFAVLAVVPASASAQTEAKAFPYESEVIRGNGFLVVADRRVFAVMALLNAVGYDAEYEGVEMHPARVAVRSELVRRLSGWADSVSRWRDTYESLDLPVWVYLDYALSLSPGAPFRRVHAEEELGYRDAQLRLEEAGFLDILNRFWEAAEVEDIWLSLRPRYLAELERYDFAKMADQLATLWAYLRMPRQDKYTLVNVPNLLDSHYQAIGAEYGRYYYQVESPGSHAYALNLHEYLHSIINPLVRERFDEHESILTEYYELGRTGEYARSYQQPMSMTAESLVRAIDHRLRVQMAESAEDVARAESRVAELAAGGLPLVRSFYDLLITEFEPGEAGFDVLLPRLLEMLPRPRG